MAKAQENNENVSLTDVTITAESTPVTKIKESELLIGDLYNFILSSFKEQKSNFDEIKSDNEAKCNESVSYTHLDVYKRQLSPHL